MCCSCLGSRVQGRRSRRATMSDRRLFSTPTLQRLPKPSPPEAPLAGTTSNSSFSSFTSIRHNYGYCCNCSTAQRSQGWYGKDGGVHAAVGGELTNYSIADGRESLARTRCQDTFHFVPSTTPRIALSLM